MNVPDIYYGGDKGRQLSVAESAFPASRKAASSDRLNIRLIWQMFRRRLGVFLTVLAITVLLAALFVAIQPRTYTATSQVEIKKGQPDVAPSNSQAPVPAIGDDDVATQIQILGSYEIAALIVDHFGLTHDPEVNPLLSQPASAWQNLLSFFGLGSSSSSGPAPASNIPPAAMRLATINAVHAGLDAMRAGPAYSLLISYSASDPVTAARLANAYAWAYSADQIDQQKQQNGAAAAFLKGKMEQLRAQSQADFADLQNYRIANNLLSTTGQSLTEQDISAYNQEAASARAQADEDAARLSTARAQLRSGSNGDDVGQALSSGVIQSLRVQQAQLSSRVADLSGRYGDRHPDLQTAKRQLADVDAQIQAEVNRVISSLQAQANVSAQRFASLNGTLQGAKAELARNNRAMVELNDLQQKADASEALYESYLNQYKQTVASSGTEQASSRLLTAAEIPTLPSAPRVLLTLALGVVLGVFFGALAALATESLFSGLTTGSEVEQRLALPYLGGVPLNKSVKPHAATILRTISEFRDSPMAESFRALLAGCVSIAPGRGKVIYVTSALPGEGKTTLAIGLARTAAINGEKAVVIDCDVLRRSLSATYAGSTGLGLRETLYDDGDYRSALVGSEAEGWILPITTPLDPGQRLMDKGRLQRLVAQLREAFDVIILDGPPVLPMAEAREMAGLADDVMLALYWRHTSEDAAKAAVKLISPSLTGRIGVVLTKIDMRKQSRFGFGDAAYYYDQYRAYYS